MKKALIRLVGLAILAGAGWGGYQFFKLLPERQEQIPTAKVQRGEVVIRAYSRGELRAVRSVTLNAPNLFGTVQTTRLAPMGSLAKEKDLIVEYDDSERKAALEEAQLNVQAVDEQIKKAKADLAIQQSQDQVTLLKTRYDVRRAELDVQRNPIISAIDGKKNVLTLEQSKRALLQLESDIQSRQDQADSQLAVLQEQRNRSLIDVQRELQRIAQTKSLAPITGLVAIRQNRAGYFNFGQQLPDIREGDTLQPGMPVADVLDLSELEVWAKVGELDRANLREGQEALLQLDAIPDKRFRGKIKAMSGTATSDVFSGDPSKKFDVIFSIDMRQLLTGLGMKPGDVERIMATAAANSKKNVVNTAASLSPGIAVAGGPGGPVAVAAVPSAAIQGGQGIIQMPGQAAGSQNDARDPAPRTPAPGPRPPAPVGMANPLEMMMRTRFSPFTEAERNNARLPLPPGEDSQVQVLLRPGLLADVEIQVEKLPDAIHIPAQAIFQKNGKHTVFVKVGGKFEPREVKLVKQSESTMVLSGGVQPGEIVALADPTVDKSARKGKPDKNSQGGGNGLGSLPGGK
jgi:HlyD family secretion protein